MTDLSSLTDAQIEQRIREVQRREQLTDDEAAGAMLILFAMRFTEQMTQEPEDLRIREFPNDL